MWCVGELDLPYRRHDLGHHFGGLDIDTFKQLNPNQTIPVLQDGDTPPIWETGAILRYLAAQYGEGTFWPQDPVQRAEVDMWAEWAKINVAMTFTVPVFWRVMRTAPSARDETAISAAASALESRLTIADSKLAQSQFISGPDLTLADIQLGHILFRYYDIGIPRAPLKHIRRYYDDLSQRRAFQEHVMISYDDLKVT